MENSQTKSSFKKTSNDFYVGWEKKSSLATARFLRRKILFFLIICTAIVISAVNLQTPFNDHVFEFTNLQEYKGRFYRYPLPTLVLDDKRANINPYALLVGYGKWGADPIIDMIEQRLKRSLDGQDITIKGKLIYGDDSTLLEVDTEYYKAGGLPTIHEQRATNDSYPVGKQEKLIGEVIDPKCYFGVMKPGEGLLHKSCAVRCISGGIPPILRVVQETSNDGTSLYQYYVILGVNGQKINSQILGYVAETIRVSGLVEYAHGWNYIKINPDQIDLVSADKE